MDNEETKKKTQIIVEKYTKNLNKAYRTEKKLEIIGREQEIKKIVYVLSRLIKNNALLVGHPGVGKTALVEGLVAQIEQKNVPRYLFDKNIYQLDMISLMSGTKFQGELEGRWKIILEYMASPKNNAILFIDEIHLIVTSGRNHTGGPDIGSLLKPMLARGEVQCIGATTNEEYYHFFEKDEALNRRFSIINVPEPNAQETHQILSGIKPFLERYYELKISSSALEAAITLSSRYFTDKYNPDKSIDLLDETCAIVKSEMWYEPEAIKIYRNELERLKFQKEVLLKKIEKNKNKEQKKIDSLVTEELLLLQRKIDEGEKKLELLLELDNNEKASIQELEETKKELERYEKELEAQEEIRDYVQTSQIKYEFIPSLKEKIKNLESEVEKNTLRNYFVKKEQIARNIARKCGLPEGKILLDEQKKLLFLLPSLQQKIKGQDRALRIISDTIICTRAGIKDPNQPLASFMFTGPTGVGKTAAALTISEHLFDTEKNFWRFDMSEFSEAHSVSKLLGSPAGYIGSEQRSHFEILREKMSSVILFDEIEKSHPEIINLFLQILDNGFLTLSNGKEVNFRNSIIVFTSNLGSEFYFQDLTQEEIEKNVKNLLKKRFSPEFINRLSEIVCFNSLNEKVIREIIIKELDVFTSRIERNKRIKLSYSKELVNKIFSESYSVEYGSRPIKQYIESNLGSLIARNIIFQVIKTEGNYSIDVEKDSKEVKLSIINLLNNAQA